MGLNLYSKTNVNDLLDSSNPFTITFDGRLGGMQDRLIYVRNDNELSWYDNIQLSVSGTIGNDITNGSKEGFEWKIIKKDIAPTHEEWSLILPGNTLLFDVTLGNSSVADTSTFLSAWVRVKIPRGQNVQTIKDVVFNLSAMAYLI